MIHNKIIGMKKMLKKNHHPDLDEIARRRHDFIVLLPIAINNLRCANDKNYLYSHRNTKRVCLLTYTRP